MDSEDIKYLDGKFGGLYQQVKQVDEKADIGRTERAVITNEIQHIKSAFNCHITKPCKNVNDHFKSEHTLRWGRVLTALALIVTIIGGAIAIVAYFI